MNKKLFTLTLTLMAILAVQTLGCLEGQYVDPLTGNCYNCDQIEYSVPGGDKDLCVCEFGFRFDPQEAKCVEKSEDSKPIENKKQKEKAQPETDKKQSDSFKGKKQKKQGKKPQKEPKQPAFLPEERNLRKGK